MYMTGDAAKHRCPPLTLSGAASVFEGVWGVHTCLVASRLLNAADAQSKGLVFASFGVRGKRNLD